MDYATFLQSKRLVATASGFEPTLPINPLLRDDQQAIVRWALKRGRAAIFSRYGTGKTPMQLEYAQHISGYTDLPVLILAPLGVARQTVREGQKFGIDVALCRSQADVQAGVNITNYEMMHRFTPEAFGGVVLDESSILKAYDGKTRTAIIEAFVSTPYRLACTATPSPNDHMELGNHAEFLGIMSRVEMLSMFFVHDGGDTSKWRLKGHAESEFWAWVCSWAVMFRRPSDIGFSDEGFDLPPLTFHSHVVESDATPEGYLFPMEALTLIERRQARRASLPARVEAAAALVNASRESWVVWCNLNAESQALAKAIPDAIEVTGSDSVEHKEQALVDFVDGRVRVVVTKPSIWGFGLNLQHCPRAAYVGLSDSFEELDQSIHRIHRYGQVNPCEIHIITSELEGAVVRNIERKREDHERMTDHMLKHMKDLNTAAVHGAEQQTMPYRINAVHGHDWTAHLGDCVEVAQTLETDSIDYSIFSPPFASLYTYSNSERDMGNCKDEQDFYQHFIFLVKELYRVMKPGRLLSFHCMQLMLSKSRDGVIGLKDFRGDLIRLFLGNEASELHAAMERLRVRVAQAEIDEDWGRANRLSEAMLHIYEDLQAHPGDSGFIYHSEVVIWKDPVTAMQRTKALGLLYKQLKKDSAMSRQGIPDYLVTMRKPGENPDPVTKDPDQFPVDLWQRYASPVWFDINPSDTLQYTSAREQADEKHICPLQLKVIERAIRLWTNPNDLVLSPFMGIGSEGHEAIRLGRRFVGIELKESYWRQACANLGRAEQLKEQPTLWDLMEVAA